MTYREHTDQHIHYLDIWDWDIIVFADHSVRILGVSSECAIHQEDSFLHGRCNCPPDRPRMSSPVVKHGVPLKESFRREATGAARHLLEAREGTEICVLSGKTYRLCGPRVPEPQPSGMSIWDFYRDPEEKHEKLSRWERFKLWLTL